MKKILCTIIWLSIGILSQAQSEQDYSSLIQLSQEEENASYDWVKSYENEYDLIFSGLFLIYKEYVSSQDASQCSFTPSCSVYAIQAIKQEGLIWGIINFFDRFSRCNGLSPEWYDHDLKHKLLIDPVMDQYYHSHE